MDLIFNETKLMNCKCMYEISRHCKNRSKINNFLDENTRINFNRDKNFEKIKIKLMYFESYHVKLILKESLIMYLKYTNSTKLQHFEEKLLTWRCL